MTRSRTILFSSLTLVSLLASTGAVTGWDLSRPMTDFFPPPIAVVPDAETNDAWTKADPPSVQAQLIELVNQERWNNGELAPLKRVDLLDTSSQTHSANMAVRDFVMHCDPDTGSSVSARIAATGYAAFSVAENIAAGFSTPSAVMSAWMSSGGHRANIISTGFREIGVGYFYQSGDQGNVRENPPTGQCPPSTSNNGPYLRYWTQNFGARSGVYPLVINREAYLTDNRNVDLYLYTGGSEMRLRNEAGTWTAWQPYAADVAWQLSPGNGTKTVIAEMRTGATVRSSSDTIILEGDSDLIFDDGFESGSTLAWSGATP